MASDQLEQLHQAVLSSIRADQYDSTTISQSEELLKASKKEDDIYYIVRGYYILGFTHAKTKEFGKAVLAYLEGARFAESSSNKAIKENLVSVYKNLAIIMGDYKYFDLAHKFNQKGLEVATELNDEKQVINLLHNEGGEYYAEEEYDQAIEIFSRILTDHSPDVRKRLGIINDLGLAYWNLKKLDKAIDQYESVLKLTESIDDANFITKVVHNLGLALMDKQEFEQALAYFEESANVSFRNGFQNNLFANYKYMGLTHLKLGRKDDAIKYYLKAAALFDETYVDPEDYDIFELIADFYLSESQLELAFQYEKRYNEHLEAYIARQKEIEALDKKYNMELVTQRYFDLLAADERHQQKVLNIQIGMGAGIIVLLSALLYILYRHYRKRIDIARQIRRIQDNSPV